MKATGRPQTDLELFADAMSHALRNPRIPIAPLYHKPTFDNAIEICGHVCRSTRSAVLFTVMRAAAVHATLPVYTKLTPHEFYTWASEIYDCTAISGDRVYGLVLGQYWEVRIYGLLDPDLAWME
jgi:hypothetical protein